MGVSGTLGRLLLEVCRLPPGPEPSPPNPLPLFLEDAQQGEGGDFPSIVWNLPSPCPGVPGQGEGSGMGVSGTLGRLLLEVCRLPPGPEPSPPNPLPLFLGDAKQGEGVIGRTGEAVRRTYSPSKCARAASFAGSISSARRSARFASSRSPHTFARIPSGPQSASPRIADGNDV